MIMCITIYTRTPDCSWCGIINLKGGARHSSHYRRIIWNQSLQIYPFVLKWLCKGNWLIAGIYLQPKQAVQHSSPSCQPFHSQKGKSKLLCPVNPKKKPSCRMMVNDKFSKYHVLNVNYIKSLRGGLSPGGLIRPQSDCPFWGWFTTLCPIMIGWTLYPAQNCEAVSSTELKSG